MLDILYFNHSLSESLVSDLVVSENQFKCNNTLHHQIGENFVQVCWGFHQSVSPL